MLMQIGTVPAKNESLFRGENPVMMAGEAQKI